MHTAAVMNDATRLAKELFVSNNDGTTVSHVLSILLVTPVRLDECASSGTHDETSV